MNDTFEMCPLCFGTYSHDGGCANIAIDPKPFTIREQKRNTGSGTKLDPGASDSKAQNTQPK